MMQVTATQTNAGMYKKRKKQNDRKVAIISLTFFLRLIRRFISNNYKNRATSLNVSITRYALSTKTIVLNKTIYKW